MPLKGEGDRRRKSTKPEIAPRQVKTTFGLFSVETATAPGLHGRCLRSRVCNSYTWCRPSLCLELQKYPQLGSSVPIFRCKLLPTFQDLSSPSCSSSSSSASTTPAWALNSFWSWAPSSALSWSSLAVLPRTQPPGQWTLPARFSSTSGKP